MGWCGNDVEFSRICRISGFKNNLFGAHANIIAVVGSNRIFVTVNGDYTAAANINKTELTALQEEINT